ncbi:hypothetical protein OPT61_g8793 [Boeremia exigua]|uniref:Uncharacterized protein n=1 Tax=Boeremia exigua TaxID=749465 RepID=A0ACC2HWV6_9PLEO|nr:hypothetical protein OPT61_g8793 [Boeremia exigua]
MLYLIHKPTGNVVIRTNNPLIVLHHQNSGWLTATSFDALLLEHPEWRPRPAAWRAWLAQATELVSRACGSVLASLSPTLALVASYTPSGTAAIASLLNAGASLQGSAPAERAGAVPIGRSRNGGSAGNASGTESRNSDPIRWMTALECRWYREQGLREPESGWLVCRHGDLACRYRLLFGVWDLDEDSEG